MDKCYEQFFTNNYPKVKSFALRILKSEEDAEDVAQDIFMKLLNMPDVWQSDGDDIKFLFSITKNHIFNILKHRTIERKYQASLNTDYHTIQEFGLEDDLYAKELRLIAMFSIEHMPDQRKKIFKMSRLEGKSTKEISDYLNLSERTVERHIYLALAELKKILLFFIFLLSSYP